MTVDQVYFFKEDFSGGYTLYILEIKDFFSSNNFKLGNHSNQLVSFKGQNIPFKLSIKNLCFTRINAKDIFKIETTF